MTRRWSLREILDLAPEGASVFTGGGPAYPWGGLYGGQIVAQGLRAATLTVSGAQPPHSLHAYFLRSGEMEREVRYEVELLRDGRSFSTRRVVAFQGDEVLATMAASFHVEEASPDLVLGEAPVVPPPEGLRRDEWSPLVARHPVPVDGKGRAAAWLRITEDLGDDPQLHACAIAFLSDDLPTDAVAMLHPEKAVPGSAHWPFFNASLDHAIWFHAPSRADAYQLHDFTGTRFRSARGLARGEIYDASGCCVATVAQEILLRPRRKTT